MKVVIYGAGGPVAAGGIRALEPGHTLRLTDLAPMETPHEFRQVDITDVEQVAAAAEGMDVLINCTVNRPDPVLAWDVNLRGAYNVAQAALRHGVPRVIHTGPAMILGERSNYYLDHDVTEDAPLRPGANLYAISKFCAHEMLRIICSHHPELCCIVFYYAQFMDHDPGPTDHVSPFAVHYDDAGQAFLRGVEVDRERLPANFEMFHIATPQPHGWLNVDKARRLLGFEAQYRGDGYWYRTPPATGPA